MFIISLPLKSCSQEKFSKYIESESSATEILLEMFKKQQLESGSKENK